MKFLVVVMSMLLASSFALAAKKHVSITEDESESTSTTSVRQHRASSADSIVRSITPEFGLVVSDLAASSGSLPTSAKTGLLVGAAVDLFNYNNFTFETGLQYKQMGASVMGGVAVIHMNYLAVPLAAKYYFNGDRNSGVYGKAGFVPAINVAHSVSDSSGNNSIDLPGTNTFDLGIMAALGGKVVLNNDFDLVLEANYVRGLTNIADSAQTGGMSIVNSSFTFLSGLAFNM